jgi:hypothetical protein
MGTRLRLLISDFFVFTCYTFSANIHYHTRRFSIRKAIIDLFSTIHLFFNIFDPSITEGELNSMTSAGQPTPPSTNVSGEATSSMTKKVSSESSSHEPKDSSKEVSSKKSFKKDSFGMISTRMWLTPMWLTPMYR